MDITEIARTILTLFKEQNLKVNDIITEKWLKFAVTDKLLSDEKLLVNDAISLLEEEEFIIIKNEFGLHLILAEKGYNQIYVIDRKKTITLIFRKIMEHFKENILNPNYKITETWLRFELTEKLNPKERELINLAIDKLIRDGYVRIEKSKELILILTDKGFDLLND